METITYFLYRHIRLDTNEPFYVGFGRKPLNFRTKIQEYPRAYTKNQRNNFWNNVVSKTNYTVEIIYETTSIIEIQEKEIEFIRLYGRKDLGNGTLVNLTDGGIVYNNVSKGSIEKRTVLRKGRKLSKDSLTKRSISRTGKYTGDDNVLSKPVYVYDIEGNYIERIGSINMTSIKLKCGYSVIHSILKGKAHSVNGYRFSYTYKDKLPTLAKKEYNVDKRKMIACLDNNMQVVMNFNSVADAAKHFKGDKSFISRVCRNTDKKAYGYFWKYI